MYRFIKASLLFGILLTLFTSCFKDQLSKDIKEIEKFIAENNLTGFQITDDNLYYRIDEPGGDQKPKLGDQVVVHYRGYYTDGEVFDSSYDRGTPIDIPLNALIEGWRKGLVFFGIGGKGMLIIPSYMGYGSRPPGTIRQDAVLVFDIELIDIK